MEILNIKIVNVKNIQKADIDIPFDNGIYTLVGANGCGKSTLMLCMAQLLSKIQLRKLRVGDIDESSSVTFQIERKTQTWKWDSSMHLSYRGQSFKFNGMYEGSLFYGTRFEDSTNIEQMIQEGKITDDRVADADKQVKEQLSYIIHGDLNHYESLMRLKNKKVAEELKISNRPYFIRVGKGLISQYRMSSGECLLISLLHFCIIQSKEDRCLKIKKF